LRASRLNQRTVLLILAEAAVVFGAIMAAAYLRFGTDGLPYELIERQGFLKAGLATAFCLAAFYLFDLYDFIIMHDRRELVLRLVQALGLAWIGLAFLFYIFPHWMIGRGVALLALPLALGLMVGWRISIHWFLGHPDFGERILIVGSGNLAVEVAREVLDRPDAGYRIVGFVGTDAELLGKSLINPRVIAVTSELAEVVESENIDRIVVAMGERRGHLPTAELLQLSLAGTVSIEEGATFYERVTGRVSLNMIRPSLLIFSGRGRQARISGLTRSVVHRFVALIGAILSLPLVVITALLIKLDSRGPVFYRQERLG
jgi:FlaA1/EpsC-like NDP-sugar epimerase